jgi:hypothetical protein
MGVRYILLFCTGMLLGQPAAAELYEPNWDRESATHAARSVDTDPLTNDLLTLTLSGQPNEVIDLLNTTATRQDWPAPARERAVHQYTRELARLPSDAVSRKVMDYLTNWQVQTLIPHDDHPQSALPMYNIRGAAQGVENSWRRQEAALEARALMASNPRGLVDAYVLESHPAARRGYIEALGQASKVQLNGVGRSAAGRIKQHPELTGLGGQAALMAGDLDLLEQVFIHGQGAALGHLMRASAKTLPAADNAALLAATLGDGPALNASIAIAELTGSASAEPGTEVLLLDHLENPELGGAVALALSRHASTDTLKLLHDLANDGEGLAAQRARLALELGERDKTRASLR